MNISTRFSMEWNNKVRSNFKLSDESIMVAICWRLKDCFWTQLNTEIDDYLGEILGRDLARKIGP